MKMYRQGDVFIRLVQALPEAAKAEPKADRVVLAYGEVTGHAHALSPSECEVFSLADAGKTVRRFLSVFDRTTVCHEEHAPIELPKGIYEIVIQREYSPEEIRNVAD